MSATDELREIIATLLKVNEDELHADSGPETIEAWDSAAHVTIILSIEDAFNIRFSERDIAELTTFGELAAATERLRAAA